MKINKKIIEELVGYLKEFNLSEIEYSEGTTKVKVSRSINNSSNISTDLGKKQSSNEKNTDSNLKVTSPIVGTAYLAPEPNAKKFIEEGQKIKKLPELLYIGFMMSRTPKEFLPFLCWLKGWGIGLIPQVRKS